MSESYRKKYNLGKADNNEHIFIQPCNVDINMQNERKYGSLIELLKRNVNNNKFDTEWFKKVREYIIKDTPTEPSHSEMKQILDELYDLSLSIEERNMIMIELLELEYDVP